jgi:hypothetical protein
MDLISKNNRWIYSSVPWFPLAAEAPTSRAAQRLHDSFHGETHPYWIQMLQRISKSGIRPSWPPDRRKFNQRRTCTDLRRGVLGRSGERACGGCGDGVDSGHGDRQGRVFTSEVRPLGGGCERDWRQRGGEVVGGRATREEAVAIVGIPS